MSDASQRSISVLGPKIIVPESALAVLGAPALGVLTVVRNRCWE
jgi:hypothetical protein